MENLQTTEIPKPMNPKDELISKLNSKSLRLSYSTLKNFTSPINLINYKLKGFTPNESMIFGSVCDCLLLTPELFDKKFKVVSSIPSTGNQINFAEALIEIGKTQELTSDQIEIEFKNHYKRGDALKTYNSLKEYIDGNIKGVTLITEDIKIQAEKVCDNLLQNDDVQILFSQITDVQKKVEWSEQGWDFIGYLDILMPDRIVDLKYSKDSNPDKFERDISNLDYFLQAAMYCRAVQKLGICDNPSYSFLVFDKNFNYSIIDLDYSYISYGLRKYKYLLQELDKCIDQNAWDQSFGFFKRIYTVSKPKWAKGFKLENDDQQVI